MPNNKEKKETNESYAKKKRKEKRTQLEEITKYKSKQRYLPKDLSYNYRTTNLLEIIEAHDPQVHPHAHFR